MPLARIWMIAALTILVTSCNNPTSTTENSSPAAAALPDTTTTTATSSAKDGSSTATNPKATFANMKQIVTKTTAAVNIGNFVRAQEEFKNFDDDNWKKVEDSVKAKSANSYKQVEDNLDEVNNGLKAAKPDKTKVLAALQSLSKTLDSYTKKY